jgi:hypothetical protein
MQGTGCCCDCCRAVVNVGDGEGAALRSASHRHTRDNSAAFCSASSNTGGVSLDDSFLSNGARGDPNVSLLSGACCCLVRRTVHQSGGGRCSRRRRLLQRRLRAAAQGGGCCRVPGGWARRKWRQRQEGRGAGAGNHTRGLSLCITERAAVAGAGGGAVVGGLR